MSSAIVGWERKISITLPGKKREETKEEEKDLGAIYRGNWAHPLAVVMVWKL